MVHGCQKSVFFPDVDMCSGGFFIERAETGFFSPLRTALAVCPPPDLRPWSASRCPGLSQPVGVGPKSGPLPSWGRERLTADDPHEKKCALPSSHSPPTTPRHDSALPPPRALLPSPAPPPLPGGPRHAAPPVRPGRRGWHAGLGVGRAPIFHSCPSPQVWPISFVGDF